MVCFGPKRGLFQAHSIGDQCSRELQRNESSVVTGDHMKRAIVDPDWLPMLANHDSWLKPLAILCKSL